MCSSNASQLAHQLPPLLLLLQFWHLLVLLLLLLFSSSSSSTASEQQCYTAIFAFGDSMSETGNYLSSLAHDDFTHVRYPPYGETFFHLPTGRYSDGRIILDFLAEAFGLPYLRPYLQGGEGAGEAREFRHGANFAFAGATALDASFFLDRGLGHVFTNNSLRAQLNWFKNLLPMLCSSKPECARLLEGSLFVVGEIGGNDYNHPLSDGVIFEEIKSFTPIVVDAILSVVNELIELGARTLVVPGTYPIGCMPTHLTEFEGFFLDHDESTGCIKLFNLFSEYHNLYLSHELDHLRRQHPHTTIIFADYFESTMSLLRAPQQFGFYGGRRTTTACCGGGGPYNYDPSVDCGCPGSVACADPSKWVYWDGYHLTEAANRVLTTNLLEGHFSFPPLPILNDMASHACHQDAHNHSGI